MNKNRGILFLVLLSGVLLPTACQRNEQGYSSRTTQPAPSQDPYYDGYEVWVGPGWYYGVYFSNEGYYRDWRRRHYHRRYGPYRYRYYRGGRYYRRGDGRGRWGRGDRGGRGGRGRR